MIRLLFIIGILSIAFGYGQTPRQNSLLVAEYQKNYEGDGNYTHLVSYNFINGKLASKDTILSAPTRKGKNTGHYVRYGSGNNFVYKNRYVISGFGNIIDVKTKSLVLEESDNLVETRGDSIIFHRKNNKTGTGYLVCDLKNRTYGFVKDKNFMSVKGMHSPNHQWGLEFDYSEVPCKLLLHGKENKQMIIMNNCGRGTLLSPLASSFMTVPIHWTDNQNFLYANYSILGVGTENITATVKIYKTNIETKDSKIVAKIDSVPPAVTNSSFSTDPSGKIIFHCSKGQFEIDFDKKQAISLNMVSIDNDFSIEHKWKDKYGRIISFKGEKIGQSWCNFYNAKSTTEFIGIEYGDVGSNLGYPKGVRVWNNITENWTDIEISWLSSIIGWIEK